MWFAALEEKCRRTHARVFSIPLNFSIRHEAFNTAMVTERLVVVVVGRGSWKAECLRSEVNEPSSACEQRFCIAGRIYFLFNSSGH